MQRAEQLTSRALSHPELLIPVTHTALGFRAKQSRTLQAIFPILFPKQHSVLIKERSSQLFLLCLPGNESEKHGHVLASAGVRKSSRSPPRL